MALDKDVAWTSSWRLVALGATWKEAGKRGGSLVDHSFDHPVLTCCLLQIALEKMGLSADPVEWPE